MAPEATPSGLRARRLVWVASVAGAMGGCSRAGERDLEGEGGLEGERDRAPGPGLG